MDTKIIMATVAAIFLFGFGCLALVIKALPDREPLEVQRAAPLPVPPAPPRELEAIRRGLGLPQ